MKDRDEQDEVGRRRERGHKGKTSYTSYLAFNDIFKLCKCKCKYICTSYRATHSHHANSGKRKYNIVVIGSS